MKESETLWSEDELLTQMEQMQDQIDRYREEKDGLARKLEEKDDRLLELEQTSSSEILKLQLTLQQAQKKLQEQSAQIVKLSSADLILKDNEKLKEENAQLQSRREQSEREAVRVEEACKRKLQRKDEELREKTITVREMEARACRKEEQADKLIRERERLIHERVDAEEKRIREECSRRFDQLLDIVRNGWGADKKKMARRTCAISMYALTLSCLLVSRSGLYMSALRQAGEQIRNLMLFFCAWLCGLVSDMTGFESSYALAPTAALEYRIVRAVVSLTCFTIIMLLIFLSVKWYIGKMKGMLTLWPAFLTLSGILVLSILFENYLTKICPVNLVFLGIVSWVTVCLSLSIYAMIRKR